MRRRSGGSYVALALALAATSCGDSRSFRDEPIRVGVIVSLSGELAAVGDHLANSARLAARELNAAGGLLGGRPIELVVVDDRTDPAHARLVAEQLIEEEGVVAILGPLASSATAEVQRLTHAARIPQVTCCATSQRLTDIQSVDDRFLFRTAPSDTIQAQVVAELVGKSACARVAILYIDDAYGEPFAGGIQQHVASGAGAGATVVATVPFTSGRSSYAAEVEQVAIANPDCVVLVAFPDDGGVILRDWNALDTPAPVLWIGTDGIKDDGFPAAAGMDAYVDGVIGTAPIVDPGTRSANAFTASYQLSHGRMPSIFDGNQYDAMILLGLAIQKAGSTDGEAIRDALFDVSTDDGDDDTIISGQMANALGLLEEPAGGVDYEGASGAVNFDAAGDVTTDYEIWRYDAASASFIQVDVITEADLNP